MREEMKWAHIHKNDLYKFMESQPSGFETVSSGSAPFVLEPLFSVPAFLARFLAVPWPELVLRFTPEDGEADLPLVASDMIIVWFEGGRYIQSKWEFRDSKRCEQQDLWLFCWRREMVEK